MKATAVLVLALGGFAGFLVWTHREAAALARGEDAAALQLATLAEGVLAAPRVEGGYRFARVEGDGLPAITVAAPERHGDTGVRWFASADGRALYVFDPVLRAAKDHRPDVAALRRWLVEPGGATRDPPAGWARLP